MLEHQLPPVIQPPVSIIQQQQSDVKEWSSGLCDCHEDCSICECIC